MISKAETLSRLEWTLGYVLDAIRAACPGTRTGQQAGSPPGLRASLRDACRSVDDLREKLGFIGRRVYLTPHLWPPPDNTERLMGDAAVLVSDGERWMLVSYEDAYSWDDPPHLFIHVGEMPEPVYEKTGDLKTKTDTSG